MHGADGGSADLLRQLLNFGSIAAEQDFRPEFFVHSDSWKAVRERRRCVVVGRKGTGKTALGFGLHDERLSESRFFANRLRFADYPWQVHDIVQDNEVGRTTRFIETWLFLILVELAKFAVEDEGGAESKARGAARAELDLFLRETWGEPTFHYRDTFTPKDYKVAKSFRPSVLGFSGGGIDWERVPRATLGPKLRTMNRWLQHLLLGAFETETQYFLVFDDLDIDMDLGNELYLDSMIGLIRAAGMIANWAREIQIDVSAVVLMRNDLYRLLQFSDKPKFDDAWVEHLTWTDEGAGPNSLKQIFNARIPVLAEEVGVAVGAEVTDWWSEIFGAGKVMDGGDAFQFMVERSYRRPRDLIKFCNLALAQAQQRWAGGEGGQQIEAEDILSAFPAYSDYLREELRAESFSHFESMNQWLELLTRIGAPSFTKEEFEAEVDRSGDLTGETTSTAILQAFFRFSVVGCANRKGDIADWGDYFWAHEERPKQFDLNAPSFLIHPGLQNALGIEA